MPIALPFADYRFTFKALEPLSLPEHSGTLWHSVLGKALHQSSCIVPKGECSSCLFQQQCDYPLLFQGVKPPQSEIMKRYRTIPTPHVIRVQQPHYYSIHRQQLFSVNIILFGEVNKKLGRLIQSMQKVGENGFRQRRIRAELIQVVQKKPQGLLDEAIPLPYKITDDAPYNRAIDYPIPQHIPQKVRLTLTSPFRPTSSAIRATRFLLDKFIMGIIRRISLLQYFYTGHRLEVDYPALQHLSVTLPVLQQTMKRQRHATLEQRNNQHQQGNTWAGSIDIDLQQHQALWPFLYLGQWVHVGKNASMGFGRYELTDISAKDNYIQ